ncbi:hypothetical protein ACG7TL_001401 [Trametes sanguinea]
MPALLVESHAALGEIKNERNFAVNARACSVAQAEAPSARASARYSLSRPHKLDLYHLLCAVDSSPRPHLHHTLSHTNSSRPSSSAAPPARPRDQLATSRSRSENTIHPAPRHNPPAQSMHPPEPAEKPRLVWDWDIEHADRQEERKADAAVHGAIPFEVDRKLLKDIVQERMGAEVARIKFLGAGTFHKVSARISRLRLLTPITAACIPFGVSPRNPAAWLGSFGGRDCGATLRASHCSQTYVLLFARTFAGDFDEAVVTSAKGYLVTLVDAREVVARVARRFMPRLKTESEVATMRYLREHTSIPVPEVYQYDSNPYNRLGGEYLLMSKAPGIALSKVFHSMPYNTLSALMENLAMMLIPLFAHRFPMIGSLYDGPDPNAPASDMTSSLATPTPSTYTRSTNISDALSKLQLADAASLAAPAASDPSKAFHVGPIVSWPFFGSARGDLAHPDEIDRGPWRTTRAYLQACAEREIRGVILENEGKAAPHRLHLDPDEIESSRHHRMTALPDDESDTSDEWDWDESEAEWDGPGDRMYQDYRRMQRTTFLVSHLKQREERVREEMGRFLRMMERLGAMSHEEGDGGGGGGGGANGDGGGGSVGADEFSLDCHDLNLENVFVDEKDNSKITCIIDWESTTTRPLWACAHVPAFLQSSPFTSKLFRATVEKLSRTAHPAFALVHGAPVDLAAVAREWLHHEAAGARLRMAHRCIEWDGWEEGLVASILGPEENEEDWFRSWDEAADSGVGGEPPSHGELVADDAHAHQGMGRSRAGSGPGEGGHVTQQAAASDSPLVSGSPTLTASTSSGDDALKRKLGASAAFTVGPGTGTGNGNGNGAVVPKVVVAVEKEREKLLNATGDFCGGRGGELGRRLEAWLYVNGTADGRVDLGRRWEGEEGEEEGEEAAHAPGSE